MKYSQALDLTLYLGPNERFTAPWQTAFLSIDNIADVLYFNPLYARLTKYLSNLLDKPYNEVGIFLDLGYSLCIKVGHW